MKIVLDTCIVIGAYLCKIRDGYLLSNEALSSQ